MDGVEVLISLDSVPQNLKKEVDHATKEKR